MIWDMVTSTVGLLSAFGSFKFSTQTNVFSLLVGIVFGNTVASIFALVLTGAIICLDIWFVDNFIDDKQRRFFEQRRAKYSKAINKGLIYPHHLSSPSKSTGVWCGFVVWVVVKLYDFYSTLLGTAVCLIPDITAKYEDIGPKEILESANLNQELFLYLLSFIVAASPIIFIMNRRSMFQI